MNTCKLGEICTINTGRNSDNDDKGETCMTPGIIIAPTRITNNLVGYVAQVAATTLFAPQHSLCLTDFDEGADLHVIAAQLNEKLSAYCDSGETHSLTIQDLSALEIEIN